MRLHTNKLIESDIHFAAVVADVCVLGVSRHGSRRRDYALEVGLSGSGNTGGQWGNAGAKSATWDEWGMFLACLFAKDDSLMIPRVYDSHEHFTWATGGFYEPFVGNVHKRHRWTFPARAVTGSYFVQSCECGAMRRYMAQGHVFAELVAA